MLLANQLPFDPDYINARYVQPISTTRADFSIKRPKRRVLTSMQLVHAKRTLIG